MSPAVAFALHVAAGILIGAVATWAIQRRHNRRLADRIARARARARLNEEIHLRRDHLGPDDDWAHRLLADIHRLPTTTRERGNQ